MKILFIADPLDSFAVKKDSTLAMMAVAQKKGFQVWHCHIHDLKHVDDAVHAVSSQITIDKSKSPWYSSKGNALLKLGYFDAVIMRTDPPFDLAYVTATWLLSQAQREGTKVFNEPSALRNHSEKLALLEFLDYAPPTIVSASLADISQFHEAHRDIIVKPLDGMGGSGIFRVKEDGLNLASIVEVMSENGHRPLMVQRYLPEIKDGDKRVLVIGGKPIPHGLARIPKQGETRGNLAAGGTGVACEVSQQELDVANAVGSELAKRGLHLVGLDFIGGYLTEINVTSPTCFVEITDQTGFDVAQAWLDSLEETVGS